jgi:hypothetical protein
VKGSGHSRPLVLTIVMWFSGIYAIGGVIGLGLAGAGIAPYSIGGMPVTRGEWFRAAAPLIAAIVLLMGATSLGLRRHRRWARLTFMSIWPLIVLDAAVCAALRAIPWSLAFRAFTDAGLVGLLVAWALFRHPPSVAYFARNNND